LQNENCPQSPNKTAIYIHGYGVNGKTFVSENAAELFSRINMSLYNSTIII
jgi:predicted esterase